MATRPEINSSLGRRGDPIGSPARPISRDELDVSDGSDDTGDEEERDGTALPTPKPAPTGDTVESPTTTSIEPPAQTVTVTQTGSGEGSSGDPQSTEQPSQSRQGLKPVGSGGPGGNRVGSPPVEGPEQDSTPDASPAGEGRSVLERARDRGVDVSPITGPGGGPIGEGDPTRPETQPPPLQVPLEQKFPGDPSRAFMEFTQTDRGGALVDRVEQALLSQIPADASRVATVLKYPVTNYLISLVAFQQNRSRTAAMQLQRAAQNLQNVIRQDLPNIG